MHRAIRSLGPALLAVSLALAGCGKGEPTAVNVVAIGDGDPTIVDPRRGELTFPQQVAMGALAQGLVRRDGSGEIVPGLAERWTVTDDGLSYIFRLGPGDWPDGREINARDVAFHLNRQLRRSSRNALKDTLGGVEEIVAMTDRVIEVRLSAPRPNLLQLLAEPEFAILRNRIGTGPFTLIDGDDEKEGAETVLRLNYRERIIDAPDVVERVNLRSASAAEAIRLFVDGDVDLVLGGTFLDLPLVRSAEVDGKALRFDPVAGLFGLVPARRSGPAADAELRRLLATAIDREALIEALAVPGLLPRTTLLQAGLDGVDDPVEADSGLGSGEEREQALVARANLLFGERERPVIAIEFPEGPGGDILLSRLAGDWGLLGIEVVRAGRGQPADFALVDRVAPSASPSWFVRSFRCSVARICSAEADELMVEARAAATAEERVAKLVEAARLIEEEQLFLPIAAPIRWSLVDSGLPGFIENNVARHPLIGLTTKPRIEGRR